MRPQSRLRILRMDNLFRKPPPSIKFAQAHLSAGGYVGNRALLSTCDHGCTGTSFESEKAEGRGQRASAFLLPSPGKWGPPSMRVVFKPLLARRYRARKITLLAIEVRLKCLRSIRRQFGSAGGDEHRIGATVGTS
jgi:hypothetical protein